VVSEFLQCSRTEVVNIDCAKIYTKSAFKCRPFTSCISCIHYLRTVQNVTPQFAHLAKLGCCISYHVCVCVCCVPKKLGRWCACKLCASPPRNCECCGALSRRRGYVRRHVRILAGTTILSGICFRTGCAADEYERADRLAREQSSSNYVAARVKLTTVWSCWSASAKLPHVELG